MTNTSFQIKQQFHVESARFLPGLPSSHPCHHMHGHSFKIEILLEGKLDTQLGWLIDFNDVSKTINPILQEIDHKVLNEVPGLSNPTSELLCYWLYNRVKPHLNQLKQVSVSETPTTTCSYPAL